MNQWCAEGILAVFQCAFASKFVARSHLTQCCERCFCQLRSGRSSGLVRFGPVRDCVVCLTPGTYIILVTRYLDIKYIKFGYHVVLHVRLIEGVSLSMFTMHLHRFRSYWSVPVSKYFTAGVRKFRDGKITVCHHRFLVSDGFHGIDFRRGG